MEQPQTSSEMDYLEQRHQEDQARIAELQQRIEAQEYELQEQTNRIRKMEDVLADAKLTLGHVPQIDERLDRMKNELLQAVEERYGQRQAGGFAGPMNATTQLESHTKTLNELRRDLDKTRRYDEQITLARTDTERLHKTVSTLQANLDKLTKQLDEQARSVRYQEEQRSIDARRVAELQTELPAMQKTGDSTIAKLKMLEQQMSQFGKYDIALEEIREEIRRHRENMDFQAAQRERQMKKWSDQAEEISHRMDENEDLMEKYSQHYQQNKRALASLQEFQERLQREQHQAEELQRLAEERQRAEMEKLQAGYGQRWQKQNMEWKTQAETLLKDVEVLKNNITEITKFNEVVEKQINMVLQIIEEDVNARAIAVQEWQQHFENLVDDPN